MRKKKAANNDLLMTIARTVGATAGMVASKAAQLTEAAKTSGFGKKASRPARKARTSKKRAVAKKTRKVASRKRTRS